jgi:hypothetical protein
MKRGLLTAILALEGSAAHGAEAASSGGVSILSTNANIWAEVVE